MDRNRKILVAILILLLLSLVMAIVDISLRIQDTKGIKYSISLPKMGPGIGVVRVDGPISFSVRKSLFGLSAGVESIIERLDELSRDSNIKAIVVRINSPGGTVAATQEIYQKLWRIRKKNIPLIASMGDIATSGGYYIASACNVIVANHGTLTGSIGVIAFSPNLKGLFDKLGIKMNVIKSGKYKDILSSHRDVSSEELKLLQDLIDSSYRKFLKDVALGRNLNQSDIEPYADGRVFIGETALKYKLIDMLGTFEDAIDKAREMAELDSNTPVYDEIKTPLQEILMSIQESFTGFRIFSENINNQPGYRLEYRYVQ